MMFASEEGFEIDKELGWKTTADYIRLIELMLMFEIFCKYYEHKLCVVLWKNNYFVVYKNGSINSWQI